MDRKAKNVTAAFPERVTTRVFGRSTRLIFVQEPSVEAFKCSNNSKHGDQLTISHPVDECTDKDSCYESGQGVNPNSALGQGLNLMSNKMSAGSHSGQSTESIVETSKDIPGRGSATNERQCELPHVTLSNNTAQVDLGVNPATKLCSSAAKKVVGSSLAYPGVDNAPIHDSADSTSDFIPIYDINHVGVEEKCANSIIRFNQFSDQSMVYNTDSDIF